MKPRSELVISRRTDSACCQYFVFWSKSSGKLKSPPPVADKVFLEPHFEVGVGERSVKEHIVNTLGFVGHMVSVRTHFCHCSTNTTVDNM